MVPDLCSIQLGLIPHFRLWNQKCRAKQQVAHRSIADITMYLVIVSQGILIAFLARYPFKCRESRTHGKYYASKTGDSLSL